ncbi:aldehyde dehydrogenase [Rhizoclosmatium globosum]|uniref:Aldehyde dehydrogenase n=1 Tax=Rhizoclosmatium globosum TaxID=329046 RepID=A0A1Y2CSS9_9FUNG|nr:aldehyde dehydrogenase [Rhizoclosmatium globosum]|eukprot:ORY49946.1 aldehyde dehydrogenase [Rhizoclosmatium globosum]
MAPATPVGEIPSIVKYLHKTFDSNKTKSLAWRKDQLTRLYDFLVQKRELVAEVVSKDNGKSGWEVEAEVIVVINEAAHALEHLDEWAKPIPCPTTLTTLTDHKVETRLEPLGVACIIGAWNFPIQLTLGPLVAAIAAGNCAVIKPSEVAPASEAFLIEWLPKILDSSAIKVVSGGVPETTALLAQKFDIIFYTGSGNVGKIIMAAAAKQLTPVVLELGGKSPVYVHEDANIETAAKRLAWAKTMNAGQVCLCPDYVLVHKNVADKLVKAVVAALKSFYPHAQRSESYSRIINKQHTKRLTTVLDRQKALSHSKVETGGSYDIDSCFIEPTVFSGVHVSDPVMEDELFGPLLGIITVENENEAIGIIKSRDRPLSLYIISESSEVVNKILDNTLSGGVIVNGYLFNMLVGDLPFGGVGASGMGNYHGRAGFLAFSHQRSLLWKRHDFLSEGVQSLAYPTVASNPWVLSLFRAAVQKWKPTFVGKVVGKVSKWGVPVLVGWGLFALGKLVGEKGWDGSLEELVSLLGL